MRRSVYFLLLVFFSLCFGAEVSASNTAEDYILKYSAIAQSESIENSIPASIILAQAILESGFGNSDLCKRSNNHFGIKWKNTNDGEFVYALDDDYDKEGNHIPSKFRKYSSAKESFNHHSQFIKQKLNYRELFKFKRTDFVNWAFGLKNCGYSTDKDYGMKLIKLIRRYNLNKYDIPVDASSSTTIANLATTSTMTKNTTITKTVFYNSPSATIVKSQQAIQQKKDVALIVRKDNVEPEYIIQSDFRDFSTKPTVKTTHRSPANQQSHSYSVVQRQQTNNKSQPSPITQTRRQPPTLYE